MAFANKMASVSNKIMSLVANFAKTPAPPYYAVIFSSQRATADSDYNKMSEKMMEVAAQQPGFLGVETVRGNDGFGITVSYWSTAESIVAWKTHAEHLEAQEIGKSRWYDHYEIKVAKVERAYGLTGFGNPS